MSRRLRYYPKPHIILKDGEWSAFAGYALGGGTGVPRYAPAERPHPFTGVPSARVRAAQRFCAKLNAGGTP